MAQLSTDMIEARLIAQRQVLAQLLAFGALGRDAGAAAAELLREGFVPQDQQEDPGAVPDPAFAIEAGIAIERRMIIEEARRLIAAADR